MRSNAVRLVVASVALAVVLSCGGGGDSASPPATTTPIGGTINTADFVIAPGETRVVNSDLRINATKSITIDGTLKVPEGFSIALLSDGDVTIDGSIIAAPGTGRQAGGGGDAAVDGVNVTINGDLTMPAGKTCNIAASGPGAKLTVNGNITAGNGKASTDGGSAGEDGGSIQLGSQGAINHAKNLGRTNDQAFATVEVNAGAMLKAGDGGEGFNDTTGVDTGPTREGSGTDGGFGGSVVMASAGPLKFAGKAQAGDGGRGGGIAPNFPVGRDGKSPLEKGQDMSVKTGNGGNGGSVFATGSPLTGTGKRIRGMGAYGGHATARAGNGGQGGHGGDTTFIVGRRGTDGTGDPSPTKPTKPVLIADRGNGGNGESSGTNGGNGGRITVRQFGGGVPQIESIAVRGNSGNGGRGADGCIEIPFSKGGNGGTAFAVDTSGSPVVPSVELFALRGGNAGSGDPPGDAGTGPGGNGLPGKPCNQVYLAVVLDQKLHDDLPAGTAIDISKIENAHVGKPEFPITADHGCAYYHLHADDQTKANVFITYNGKRYGPFGDPNKAHCGFGRVMTQDRQRIPGPFNAPAGAQANAKCCGQAGL